MDIIQRGSNNKLINEQLYIYPLINNNKELKIIENIEDRYYTDNDNIKIYNTNSNYNINFKNINIYPEKNHI